MAYAYGVKRNVFPMSFLFMEETLTESGVRKDTALPTCPTAGSTKPIASALVTIVTMFRTFVSFIGITVRLRILTSPTKIPNATMSVRTTQSSIGMTMGEQSDTRLRSQPAGNACFPKNTITTMKRKAEKCKGFPLTTP